MLTEERLQEIWRIVKERGSVSIQELMDTLDISESSVSITKALDMILVKFIAHGLAQSKNLNLAIII